MSETKNPSRNGGEKRCFHSSSAPCKPKQPLSTYNLFFQLERKRILSGTDSRRLPPTLGELQEIIRQHKQKGKRLHRKTHGKIGFRELTRMVAKRWKIIDPSTKEILEYQANIEKKEFKHKYNKWMEAQESSNLVTALRGIHDSTSATSTKYDHENKPVHRLPIDEMKDTSTVLTTRALFCDGLKSWSPHLPDERTGGVSLSYMINNNTACLSQNMFSSSWPSTSFNTFCELNTFTNYAFRRYDEEKMDRKNDPILSLLMNENHQVPENKAQCNHPSGQHNNNPRTLGSHDDDVLDGFMHEGNKNHAPEEMGEWTLPLEADTSTNDKDVKSSMKDNLDDCFDCWCSSLVVAGTFPAVETTELISFMDADEMDRLFQDD